MIGTVVGQRYRLEEVLGEGGMGIVYRGVDEHLDRPVAVKLIRAVREGIDLVERLEREARAAARLGHPNIVPVLDFGHGDPPEPSFLVMQLLEGRSLRDVLKDGPMPLGRALEIHIQLLEGLAAAHRASVVHRDLKPANVIITPLGPRRELARILDFGLAYLMEDGAKKLTQHGISLGTPAYMAPERIAGEPTTASCDLYSIGVCLYQAVTGELPFHDPNPAVLQGRVILFAAPDIRDRCPDAPEALAALVAKALAKKPADRYSSAEELRDQLQAVLDELDSERREAVLAPSEKQRVQESELETRIKGGVNALGDGLELASDARGTKNTVRVGSLPLPSDVPTAAPAVVPVTRQVDVVPLAATAAPQGSSSPSAPSPPNPAPTGPETAYELPVVERSFWRPFAASLGVVILLGLGLVGVLMLSRSETDTPQGSSTGERPETPSEPVVAPMTSVDASTAPEPANSVPSPVVPTAVAIPTHAGPEQVPVPVAPRPPPRPLPTPVVEPAERPTGPARPQPRNTTEVLEPDWD